MRRWAAFLTVALLATLSVQAGLVKVEITGSVEFNQVRPPASFNGTVVRSGDPVTVMFLVDSEVFVDSASFPVRGYPIILDSYSLRFDTETGPVIEPLANPYPGTPYFVVRNNDPAVDGFYVSTNNVDFPIESLYVDETARLAPYFQQAFEASYPQERLSSLDIYGAVGVYDYDGLSAFYFSIIDGPFDAMSLLYTQMTISRVPVEVPVDFRPGSCPNPLNLTSKGVLPVAILGTAELDVTNIDPASILLNGMPPLRWSFEDVGTPFMPYIGKFDCAMDCNDYGPDGYYDLSLKFDTEAIAATLGDPPDGMCVALTLTGNFKEDYDAGGPIIGEDVASILNKGRGPSPRGAYDRDRISDPPTRPMSDPTPRKSLQGLQ